MAQNIVIVGGGPAGVVLFNEFGSKLSASEASVIMVTPRPYFTWLPACPRMLVTEDGELEKRVLMPFPDNFNEGNRKVVLSKVVSIHDGEEKAQRFVTLDNGETIEFSVLILAPGSKWDGPLGFPESKEEDLEFIKKWRKEFAEAKDIVLIGGGAVGVELAGELVDEWPTKPVTLVHGHPLLLTATYPDKFRQDVVDRLIRRGVNLVLGDYVDDIIPKDGKITTRKGTDVPADLVISTRGGKPNTEFIRTLGSDVLDDGGYIRVRETLQLVDHPRIFAAGNAIDIPEGRHAYKAARQALIVAKNTVALVRGSDDPKTLWQYRGGRNSITLSIGKDGGACYFDVLWGLMFGDYFASLKKSRGLMIDMVKRRLQL
ncbi:hypothetical protein NLJ89_g11045 [Agrocybe chaxingu]|uniref:FAD/NAD(P)-binding domain-containing protein n=1 Tax=Agrocybe chaxingu TaxID=84603 RepID=A0A9W8JQP1_9AGAR|nr:hypothetical protein NLJ89_g11045 [Agrocybe chaxingu]